MSSRISVDALRLNEPDEVIERISRFIKTHYDRANVRYLVVGMSGGLDSSVTAALCSKAIGGRNILGFALPEDETRNEQNVKLAMQVAKKFHITFQTINITTMVNAATTTLSAPLTKKELVPYANLKARLRMIVLYYFANKRNGLVVGTSDKSETMLGYFTKYGDGACDIEPLADLYKTSVRFLGKKLGIPKMILDKPPSPELWQGQTAKQELGASYDKIDLILWSLERWMDTREISQELKLPVKLVNDVRQRLISSEHKRRPPLVMKMGFRTAGQDLRIPYSLS